MVSQKVCAIKHTPSPPVSWSSTGSLDGRVLSSPTPSIVVPLQFVRGKKQYGLISLGISIVPFSYVVVVYGYALSTQSLDMGCYESLVISLFSFRNLFFPLILSFPCWILKWGEVQDNFLLSVSLPYLIGVPYASLQKGVG